MGVRLRRPSDAELRSLLVSAAASSLTYEPTGSTVDESIAVPAGLTRRRWTSSLRNGSAFDRGRRVLAEWRVHRDAGLSVVADGPLVVGTNVAMCAPLPIGFVEATCRIVAMIEEVDRYGFAYGTLDVHPERGEESFVVARTADRTTFTVEAVSRPAHPLARLAPPVADVLQSRAVKRYLSAFGAAVD